MLCAVLCLLSGAIAPSAFTPTPNILSNISTSAQRDLVIAQAPSQKLLVTSDWGCVILVSGASIQMVQKWWCSNGEQHLDRWKDSQSVYDVYSRSRRRTLLALVAAGEQLGSARPGPPI